MPAPAVVAALPIAQRVGSAIAGIFGSNHDFASEAQTIYSLDSGGQYNDIFFIMTARNSGGTPDFPTKTRKTAINVLKQRQLVDTTEPDAWERLISSLLNSATVYPEAGVWLQQISLNRGFVGINGEWIAPGASDSQTVASAAAAYIQISGVASLRPDVIPISRPPIPRNPASLPLPQYATPQRPAASTVPINAPLIPAPVQTRAGCAPLFAMLIIGGYYFIGAVT